MSPPAQWLGIQVTTNLTGIQMGSKNPGWYSDGKQFKHLNVVPLFSCHLNTRQESRCILHSNSGLVKVQYNRGSNTEHSISEPIQNRNGLNNGI